MSERAAYAADTRLADLVRKGWVTPPVLQQSNIPAALPVMPFEQVMKDPGASRADHDMIYLDSCVVLAHVLSETRRPQPKLATYDTRMIDAAKKLKLRLFRLQL